MLSLAYVALLWVTTYALHKAADRLLLAQSRFEFTANSERRWAMRVYTYTRTALDTLAACTLALGLFLVMH